MSATTGHFACVAAAGLVYQGKETRADQGPIAQWWVNGNGNGNGEVCLH